MSSTQVCRLYGDLCARPAFDLFLLPAMQPGSLMAFTATPNQAAGLGTRAKRQRQITNSFVLEQFYIMTEDGCTGSLPQTSTIRGSNVSKGPWDSRSVSNVKVSVKRCHHYYLLISNSWDGP